MNLTDLTDIAAAMQASAIQPGPPWRVVESPLLVRQYRFPRSRRRRIRQKWAKVKGNWRPDPLLYIAGDTIYGHPQIVRQILRKHQDVAPTAGYPHVNPTSMLPSLYACFLC